MQFTSPQQTTPKMNEPISSVLLEQFNLHREKKHVATKMCNLGIIPVQRRMRPQFTACRISSGAQRRIDGPDTYGVEFVCKVGAHCRNDVLSGAVVLPVSWGTSPHNQTMKSKAIFQCLPGQEVWIMLHKTCTMKKQRRSQIIFFSLDWHPDNLQNLCIFGFGPSHLHSSKASQRLV